MASNFKTRAVYSDSVTECPYDKRFVSPWSKNHECPVCYDFMVDPVIACRNGHTYCRECITKCNKCPECRLRVRVKEQTRFALGFFNQLQVYCDHHENGWWKDENNPGGCSWVGRLDELDNHMKRCDHVLSACSFEGCVFLLTAKELKDHLAVCDFRPVLCDCGLILPHVERGIHGLTCEEMYLECDCGDKVRRKDMDAHQFQHQVIECEVCKDKFERKDAEAHRQSNWARHETLFQQRIADLESKQITEVQLNLDGIDLTQLPEEALSVVGTEYLYEMLRHKPNLTRDKTLLKHVVDLESKQISKDSQSEVTRNLDRFDLDYLLPDEVLLAVGLENVDEMSRRVKLASYSDGGRVKIFTADTLQAVEEAFANKGKNRMVLFVPTTLVVSKEFIFACAWIMVFNSETQDLMACMENDWSYSQIKVLDFFGHAKNSMVMSPQLGEVYTYDRLRGKCNRLMKLALELETDDALWVYRLVDAPILGNTLSYSMQKLNNKMDFALKVCRWNVKDLKAESRRSSFYDGGCLRTADLYKHSQCLFRPRVSLVRGKPQLNCTCDGIVRD